MSFAPSGLFLIVGAIGFGVLLAGVMAIVWAVMANRRGK